MTNKHTDSPMNEQFKEKRWPGEWDDLLHQVLSFLSMKSDDETDAPDRGMIIAAIDYIRCCRTRKAPANSVYTLPDGAIVFEWRHSDGTTEQLEIQGIRKGELMVIRPGSRAVFSDVQWQRASPVGWIHTEPGWGTKAALATPEKRPTNKSCEWGSEGMYTLAA